MQDYLSFKKMITPIIIQILFWIAVVVLVLTGLLMIGGALLSLGRDPVTGLLTAFGGFLFMLLSPIVARVYAEILIVLFRMNDTLTDISHSLERIERKP